MTMIHVTGAAPSDHLNIEHIIGLFFEEPLISFENGKKVEVPSSEQPIHIDVKITGEQRIHAVTRLTDAAAGAVYTGEQEREAEGASNSKEWRKQAKQVLHFSILQALEQYTGLIQPWGILTGVRPTKLMHNELKAGSTPELALMRLKERYGIQEEKIQLMQRIVDRQLEAIPDLYQLRQEVSVYIGIPFCPTKCAYCTFPAYAINGRQGSVDSFLGGLHYEMDQIGNWLKRNGVNVTTVYFGGGTPTSITAEEMDMLYDRLFQSFPNPERIREITVEAGRPDTITPEKLEVLKKWGIHRISINPQSYIQETLKAIGRHHTVQETIDKFHLARSMGMDNINMDLIIGLPGEGMEQFEHTLRETEKLMPESLTVHTLSFKRASEMTQNKAKYKVADREEVSRMMRAASDWTDAHGYDPYYLYRQKNILGNLENVGYCLPGMESMYNIIIMEEVQSIIGLGCGASTKWVHPKTGQITRYANPKEPKAYNDHFEKYTHDKLDTLEELFAKQHA
ncbi:coproporphyrinogen III oxidase [Marinicrinis lubricantis]|uniref:Coproporphyrinogen III oxidase n=1 Tax=Marinicrinis lubricantis TaxID=2086470 RepID=A0ABW1IVX2_9BACL